MCGFKTRIAVYVVLVCSYFYVLSLRGDWCDDDMVVANAQYMDALFVFKLLYALHTGNMHVYLFIIFRNVWLYGSLRVILFCVSLAVITYCLVFAADELTLFTYRTFGDEVVKRLEDSIVHIKEERHIFDGSEKHPLTGGKEEPRYIHKQFRYPMEDTQMACSSNKLLWFADKPLKNDHVTWRLNGVPLQFTDRHTLDIKSSELSFMTGLYREDIKEYGVSVYEVRATLTIHLLSESDFGSYTCHVKNTMALVLDYIAYMDHLKLSRFQTSGKNTQDGTEEKWRNTKEERESNQERPTCQCEQVPITWYVPQDTVTWTEEYRLIKLESKQQNLTLPPASILSFTTIYMTLNKDDIEIEYLVNDNDYGGICPDQYHGCSMILLYYWMHDYELGKTFIPPPYRKWYPDGFSWVEESEHVLCLCENSYGIHSVRYQRRYFNRTTQQHELIEITHPHTLAIIPREQTMFDVNFINRSAYDAEMTAEKSSPESIGYFDSCVANVKLWQQLAVSMVKLFNRTELAVLAAVAVLCALASYSLKLFLYWLGHAIRKCTLYGYLAYFITAIRNNAPEENKAAFDILLSYSDAERDVHVVRDVVAPHLEALGSRVCVPDRDLPPNELELTSLNTAVDHSKRFIIFLSHDYAQDRFRQEFEGNMIVESVVARPAEPKQILIVRLDTCEVPLSLRHLPVYDWAGNLTDEDHILWLRRWLEPMNRAARPRCSLDVFMSVLPLGLFVSALIVYKIYSFLN